VDGDQHGMGVWRLISGKRVCALCWRDCITVSTFIHTSSERSSDLVVWYHNHVHQTFNGANLHTVTFK
jgi:hypothetical protein